MDKSLVMQAGLQGGFPPYAGGNVRCAHGGAINPRGLLHAPGHTQTGLPPQQSFTLACIRPAAGLHHRHHAAIHFRDEPPGQRPVVLAGQSGHLPGQYGQSLFAHARCRGPQSGNAPSPVRRPEGKKEASAPKSANTFGLRAGADIRVTATRWLAKGAETHFRVAQTATTVPTTWGGRRQTTSFFLMCLTAEVFSTSSQSHCCWYFLASRQ